MENAFEVLKERGFIEQLTHPEEIEELFGKEKITFYIGFDPTAVSYTHLDVYKRQKYFC